MNYRTLPRGYRHVEYMDFVRNRRQLLTVNLSALGATALLIVLGLMTHSIRDAWRAMNERWWLWLALAGMLISILGGTPVGSTIVAVDIAVYFIFVLIERIR